MKKKFLQLPRGYLSYSQIQLWKSDRERYIGIYMDNRQELRMSNAGQEYGRVVATALEKGVQTDDLLTDASMLLLPKYDIADKEIEVETRTKYGWLKIVGRPDTLNSKTKDFREVKTGKHEWNRSKAQRHPQMIFYALIIYLKWGVALDHAYLDWIETQQTSDGLKPTGRVESYTVFFTLKEILRELKDTIDVARDIESSWVTHITNPGINQF